MAKVIKSTISDRLRRVIKVGGSCRSTAPSSARLSISSVDDRFIAIWDSPSRPDLPKGEDEVGRGRVPTRAEKRVIKRQNCALDGAPRFAPPAPVITYTSKKIPNSIKYTIKSGGIKP